MVRHFRELQVYRQAFKAAQRIFDISNEWPPEERYSLTDQIRRASRSVCANIAEAWRKRRYERHFISKLSDADAEAAETQSWLDFVLGCGYLDKMNYQQLDQDYELIIGGLIKMIAHPETWCGPSNLVRDSESAYEPAPLPPTTHTPTR